MTLRQFLKENKMEIDKIILEFYGVKVSNNHEREEWILNDRGLYAWAHQEGVNI
jgi:hypothetical protein